MKQAGTEARRDQERRKRLRWGRPCRDFLREWEQQRPPEDTLKFYGTWPDAKPERVLIRP